MPAPYPNIHGRKGTRGVRPYLLAPKVLAVAGYFGGVLAAGLLWVHYLRVSARQTPSVQPWTSDLTRLLTQQIQLQSLLFTRLIIPAVAACLVLGLLLLLQHPLIFLRQRWFQVKLLLLALGAMVSHFWMRSRLHLLESLLARLQTEPASDAWVNSLRQVQWQYSTGLAVVTLGAITLILLSRIKPRLGQNWARHYPGQTASPAQPTASGETES